MNTTIEVKIRGTAFEVEGYFEIGGPIEIWDHKPKPHPDWSKDMALEKIEKKISQWEGKVQ